MLAFLVRLPCNTILQSRSWILAKDKFYISNESFSSPAKVWQSKTLKTGLRLKHNSKVLKILLVLSMFWSFNRLLWPDWACEQNCSCLQQSIDLRQVRPDLALKIVALPGTHLPLSAVTICFSWALSDSSQHLHSMKSCSKGQQLGEKQKRGEK